MALILVIIITFDVSEKLDDFLGNHAPLRAIIFDYYCNFLPGFVNLYSPLFIFISVIFFTSKMAGNTEVIAILGSGISYRRMLQPYLIGSVIVAIVVMLIGNFVIPISNKTLSEFEWKYIHTNHKDYYSNIHFQAEPGVQVYAESYDVEQRYAHQLSKDTYDSDGMLLERITADHATYDTATGKWNCHNYCHRTINGLEEMMRQKGYSTVDLGVTMDDFDQASVDITTLNSIALYHYIEREKMRGTQNVITSLIELYQRILNPISIIIMTYIGVAVSSRKVRGGIGLHLAIGISIAFAFIIFMRVGVVFATNGNLPPFLAVLVPQVIFAIVAVLLVRKAPK